jgi:hypothetical protein
VALHGNLLEHFSDARDRDVIVVDAEGKEHRRFNVGTIAGLLAEHIGEHIDEIQAIREMHTV